MIKEEAIEKLQSEAVNHYSETSGWVKKIKLDIVTDIVNQINEPEKPVLTKEEAEWVDKLTNSNNLSDSLYYITRCGFRYPFVFVDNGKVYKLSIELKDIKNYDDLCKIKDRLIKAVIFGYEVEKEKLYTVKFANEDFGKIYIGIHKETNTLRFGTLPLNNEKVKSWFTEDELKRLKFWDNPAFETEEVKE